MPPTLLNWWINYLSNYAKYIFRSDSHPIATLDVDEFMQLCIHASYSSPGLDSWSPTDFAILSRSAFEWLVAILNLIEQGRPWPSGLLRGKATLLQKDGKDELDHLNIRILLIMPII